MITAEKLRELLTYNPYTGVFTVNTKPHGSHKDIGDPIGSIKRNGYVAIVLKNKHYQAHRLAWLYSYGEYPKGQIDHINGNKSDNRIVNLRVATASENAQNLKNPKLTNKTKLIGVRKKANRNVYESSIKINGKSIYIGCFKTAEEAHKAYVAKKRELHPFSNL